jgi:hypothetical protein
VARKFLRRNHDLAILDHSASKFWLRSAMDQPARPQPADKAMIIGQGNIFDLHDLPNTFAPSPHSNQRGRPGHFLQK